jgi:hypothetical protein
MANVAAVEGTVDDGPAASPSVNRLVTGIPVGIVVRLPRLHDSMNLVAQVVPILAPASSSPSDRGTGDTSPPASMLVEWTSGHVTPTTDTDGLLAEEQMRRRHYFQLAPIGSSSAALNESATPVRPEAFAAVEGVPLPVPHVSALPTQRCVQRENGTDIASSPLPPGAPMCPRAVSREQLKRLRAWSVALQSLDTRSHRVETSVPRTPSLPLLPHFARDVALLRVSTARVVPADERAPWAYVPGLQLQQLTGLLLHGANVRAEPADERGADCCRAAVVVGLRRHVSPHDQRFIGLQDLHLCLEHTKATTTRTLGQVRRLQAEAAAAVKAALLDLVKARLYIAAEVCTLQPQYRGDAEVRERVLRLLDWYERHGSPNAAIEEARDAKIFPVDATEKSLLEEVQRDTAGLDSMVLNPSTLPHALACSKQDAASSRRKPHQARLATIGTKLGQVLTVSLHLGRTPLLSEIANVRGSN